MSYILSQRPVSFSLATSTVKQVYKGKMVYFGFLFSAKSKATNPAKFTIKQIIPTPKILPKEVSVVNPQLTSANAAPHARPFHYSLPHISHTDSHTKPCK